MLNHPKITHTLSRRASISRYSFMTHGASRQVVSGMSGGGQLDDDSDPRGQVVKAGRGCLIMDSKTFFRIFLGESVRGRAAPGG